MTVIYSNMMDDDCAALRRVWCNLPDVTVVEVRPDSENYEEEVNQAIAAEEDTLILLGHGDANGLYFPNFYRGEYLVHPYNVGLIRARNVICCWCYASTFCYRQNLRCFATSMFISNEREALDNSIIGYTQDMVNANSDRFYTEINQLLRDGVPLSEWFMRLGAHMDIDNAVDVFNRQGLMYFE